MDGSRKVIRPSKRNIIAVDGEELIREQPAMKRDTESAASPHVVELQQRINKLKRDFKDSSRVEKEKVVELQKRVDLQSILLDEVNADRATDRERMDELTRKFAQLEGVVQQLQPHSVQQVNKRVVKTAIRGRSASAPSKPRQPQQVQQTVKRPVGRPPLKRKLQPVQQVNKRVLKITKLPSLPLDADEQMADSDDDGFWRREDSDGEDEQRSETGERSGEDGAIPFGKVAAVGHTDDYNKQQAPKWAAQVDRRFVAVYAPHHSIFDHSGPLPEKRQRKSIKPN